MNVQEQIEAAYSVVVKARAIEAFIEVRILDEHPEWEEALYFLEDDWLDAQDTLFSDFIGQDGTKDDGVFDEWIASEIYFRLRLTLSRLADFYRSTAEPGAAPEGWKEYIDRYVTAINNFVMLVCSQNGWEWEYETYPERNN